MHGDASGYARWGKRGLDLVVGTALSFLVLPVIAVLAVGAAIVFRTNPFFVQRRTGRDGREFRCPKIRTLPRATAIALDKYALADLSVPHFGTLLRRFHLDELPQVLLVPLGIMSLVGPRPEMVEMRDRYPESFRRVRERVRPGCTGLWQVSVAVTGMIYEAPEYDERYVEGLSLRLDLWILGQTVRSMFGRERVRLEDLAARGFGESADPSVALDPQVETEPV